jgi:hypothetical protein
MPSDANPERIGPLKVDVSGYQSVRRRSPAENLRILFFILYSPTKYYTGIGSWILSVDRASISLSSRASPGSLLRVQGIRLSCATV